MTSTLGTVSTLDDTVSRVVDMLRTWHRLTKAELAEATGIPLRTLSRRLNGGGHWEWQEVNTLAAHFDVPVSVFKDGPEALIKGARASVIQQYLGDTSPTRRSTDWAQAA
jgi:transcriptional regulator with XRE-family HTH domain